VLPPSEEDAPALDSWEATFVASESAPREAREFLRRSLATRSLDRFVEVSELLVTELVANVVRHVGSSAVVRVCPLGNSVRVEVDDDSTQPPCVQPLDTWSFSGRGLRIVEGYASSWGTEVGHRGKTVWFEIEIAPTKIEDDPDDHT
jgi:hypothetical protein